MLRRERSVEMEVHAGGSRRVACLFSWERLNQAWAWARVELELARQSSGGEQPQLHLFTHQHPALDAREVLDRGVEHPPRGRWECGGRACPGRRLASIWTFDEPFWERVDY